MKIYVTILLSLVLGITGNAQKLNGNWKGKMIGPNGDFELFFTFNASKDSLTGSVTSDMGTLPLENGKVNGNQFSFDVNVEGQVISNTGVLDDDTIKLNASVMEKPMELTRVMEKSKIDGKWIGKVSGPQGDVDLTFTFKVEGDKLTGKNSSSIGELDLLNGVVNGNEFSFDVDLQGMRINHKCKYLDDDSIDVKAEVMDQNILMKLTRADQ
ncbi:MAG TPA: hypothetical protein VMT35_07010 [Ignavibacteriaceae bacterium]|nr:hypothetical protein [Ignavibacteriaceae bacterium]